VGQLLASRRVSIGNHTVSNSIWNELERVKLKMARGASVSAYKHEKIRVEEVPKDLS